MINQIGSKLLEFQHDNKKTKYYYTINDTISAFKYSIKMRIRNGWIDNVRRVSSPNYDERPFDTIVNLLVIHAISLPPGEFGGPWIDDLFMNRLDKNAHSYFQEISNMHVSSHLLISRDGEVTQYVPFNKRAWHAGISEYQGKSNCNDFSIGIELEGFENIAYEEAQYLQLSKLTRVIVSAFPEISNARIVGHCDISPQRKQDPYSSFEWEKYFNLLETQ